MSSKCTDFYSGPRKYVGNNCDEMNSFCSQKCIYPSATFEVYPGSSTSNVSSSKEKI